MDETAVLEPGAPGGPPPACAHDVRDGPEVVAGLARWREALSAVDTSGWADRDRVDLIAELERCKGAASAGQARATDALRRDREVSTPQDAVRSVGSEVALARRESPSLGDRFVGLSRALTHEMPCTMLALDDGVIGERHAVAVVQATSTLALEDRTEVDRRMGPLLGRLGVGALARAAQKVAGELDAASVVTRMEHVAGSRRVTVRPAPDGMAYLTVLAPLGETVGAYASLRARATAVVGGQCPDEPPNGRGVGAVMADTATRLMSGRAVGATQPVEVHLVMTDTALLGARAGEPRTTAAASAEAPTGRGRSPDPVTSANTHQLALMEAARIPGHGSVPAPVARRWIRDADEGSVWLRRLFTSPDGRNLVAMDSRRRVFTGLLRRMLVLRDDRCSTPWCDGIIAHADHATPARDGGATDFRTGNGKCARCNYAKEAPGWRTTVPNLPPVNDDLESVPHQVEVTTPVGRRYRSLAPPLLGWGWSPEPSAVQLDRHGTPRRHKDRTAPATSDGTAAIWLR